MMFAFRLVARDTGKNYYVLASDPLCAIAIVKPDAHLVDIYDVSRKRFVISLRAA